MRHTADAWEHGLSAAMDHDVHEARHVMRGATARRSLLRTAHQHLERCSTTPGHIQARSASPLTVVDDLTRINRLLDQLSQSVIATPDGAAPDDQERADIDAARRIGSRRLWYFAEAMPRPAIDREYIAAGHDLLDALADLADRAPTRGSTSDVCLALMISLVETSRHVTRIA